MRYGEGNCPICRAVRFWWSLRFWHSVRAHGAPLLPLIALIWRLRQVGQIKYHEDPAAYARDLKDELRWAAEARAEEDARIMAAVVITVFVVVCAAGLLWQVWRKDLEKDE